MKRKFTFLAVALLFVQLMVAQTYKTVSDIMTRTPKTVKLDTKITEIQRIMNKYKVHSVLVTDEKNHLLGVVDHYSCMI